MPYQNLYKGSFFWDPELGNEFKVFPAKPGQPSRGLAFWRETAWISCPNLDLTKIDFKGKKLKAWVWSLFKSVLLNTFIPRLSTLVYIVFASVWSQLSIICIQLYIVIIYLLHKQEFPFMVFCFYESMAISNIAICDVRHSSPMYTVLLKWEKTVQYHIIIVIDFIFMFYYRSATRPQDMHVYMIY